MNVPGNHHIYRYAWLLLPLLLLQLLPAMQAGGAQPASTDPGQAGISRSQSASPSDAVRVDIRDIKGPIEIPTVTMAPVLAAAAGVILLAFCLLLYLRRRRQAAVPGPPAHETALEQLRQARTLMDSGEGEAFAARLAEILRSYIETRFRLSARNLTTGEFVEALTVDPAVPSLLREHRQELQQWLHHCDMAKFACSPPTPEQMESMYSAVSDFIRSTRPLTGDAATGTAADGTKTHDNTTQEVRP